VESASECALVPPFLGARRPHAHIALFHTAWCMYMLLFSFVWRAFVSRNLPTHATLLRPLRATQNGCLGGGRVEQLCIVLLVALTGPLLVLPILSHLHTLSQLIVVYKWTADCPFVRPSVSPKI